MVYEGIAGLPNFEDFRTREPQQQTEWSHSISLCGMVYCFTLQYYRGSLGRSYIPFSTYQRITVNFAGYLIQFFSTDIWLQLIMSIHTLTWVPSNNRIKMLEEIIIINYKSCARWQLYLIWSRIQCRFCFRYLQFVFFYVLRYHITVILVFNGAKTILSFVPSSLDVSEDASWINNINYGELVFCGTKSAWKWRL